MEGSAGVNVHVPESASESLRKSQPWYLTVSRVETEDPREETTKVLSTSGEVS